MSGRLKSIGCTANKKPVGILGLRDNECVGLSKVEGRYGAVAPAGKLEWWKFQLEQVQRHAVIMSAATGL